MRRQRGNQWSDTAGRVSGPRSTGGAGNHRPRIQGQGLALVLAIGGVRLTAISAHAQAEIQNGPVAIRPMVSAPQLLGKTPPIPPAVLPSGPAAGNLTCGPSKEQRQRPKPKEIVPAGGRRIRPSRRPRVMDDGHSPTYCDEACNGPLNMCWGTRLYPRACSGRCRRTEKTPLKAAAPPCCLPSSAPSRAFALHDKLGVAPAVLPR